jgi:hypothetical protein
MTKMSILNLVFKKEYKSPLWIKVVAPVTLLYLIFELSFNSHLLDVMSTTTSESEITVIEHWGRLLSGFAVALTCWPSLLSFCNKRDFSFRKVFSIVAVWTVLVMALIFHFEWKLNESIVSKLSNQEKSHAALMSLLQNDVIHGDGTIPGYTKLDISSPAQKAVFALIPFFGMGMNGFDFNQIEQNREAMIAHQVRDSLMTQDSLNKVNKLANSLNAQWDSYLDAEDSYKSEKVNAYHRADAYYASLVSKVHYMGASIPVNENQSSRLVSMVRGAGFAVPYGWRGDRETFNNVAYSKIEKNASYQWTSSMGSIPMGLSQAQFLTNVNVVNKILTSAGFPLPYKEYPVTLKHYDSLNEDYVDHFVVPVGLAKTLDTRKAYVADDASYAKNGAYGEFGAEQARAVVSPVLALIFSTLGAMIHLFKGLIYLVHLFSKVSFRYSAFKMASIFAGVMFLTFIVSPFMGGKVCNQPFVSNAFASSTSYLTSWTDSDVGGNVMASFLKSSVRMQTLLYPMGHNSPVSTTVFSKDLTPWAN